MKARFFVTGLATIPGQSGTSVELRPVPLETVEVPLETVESPLGEEGSDVPALETRVVPSELFGTETPSGCIQIFLNNPSAEAYFQIGQKYEIAFQRA